TTIRAPAMNVEMRPSDLTIPRRAALYPSARQGGSLARRAQPTATATRATRATAHGPPPVGRPQRHSDPPAGRPQPHSDRPRPDARNPTATAPRQDARNPPATAAGTSCRTTHRAPGIRELLYD